MNAESERPAKPTVEFIPLGLRIGAVYAACLLLIAAALAVVGVVLWTLAAIVVPALMGLILCALLMPLCRVLRRHHWPKWAAIAVAWLLVLIVASVLVTLLVQQVIAHMPELSEQASALLKKMETFAGKHPLGLTDTKVTKLGDQAADWLQQHLGDIGLQTWIAGRGALDVITGAAIGAVVSIFLLSDGDRMWQWVVRLFPSAARRRLDAAGRAGWHTLIEFPRVQVMIAVFDAVLIGAGALLLGVPLVLPIATLVFFGALIPIVGAIATGVIAVALALLANGWVNAAVMLGIVLAVNQIESHVVQPVLAGNAFKVHPLVVVLGVLAGISLGGIGGAFFAVPLIATAHAMIVAAKEVEKPRVASADGG